MRCGAIQCRLERQCPKASQSCAQSQALLPAKPFSLRTGLHQDFVIATGMTTPVREFARKAFFCAGIELEFTGEGLGEKGVVAVIRNPDVKLAVGDVVIEVDQRYFRPTEVDLLVGDAAKAKALLGWQPRYSVDQLAKEMVENDIAHFQQQLVLKNAGFPALNNFE